MFKNMDIGRASALAVILFALVLAASAAALRWLKGEPAEA
jgi:ABC-type sugar transport system permease subunit